MANLDRIFRELSLVTTELWSLGETSSERRYELEQRRDILRRSASVFAERKDQRRTIFELDAELVERRRQLDELKSTKMNMVLQTQNIGVYSMPIAGPGDGTLNDRLMRSRGADTVMARIAELQEELRLRGLESSPAG